jgi:hypothetical protein
MSATHVAKRNVEVKRTIAEVANKVRIGHT